MTFGGKVCLFKLQKGSKIYLLSKMYIFSENIQKSKIFKKSKKNLLVSKMEQNPFSCSIGIWNYHLTPSKSESRIFLWPYASPLCSYSNFYFVQFELKKFLKFPQISIQNLIFEAFLEQKIFVASHYLMSKCRFFLSSLTETIYCYIQNGL